MRSRSRRACRTAPSRSRCASSTGATASGPTTRWSRSRRLRCAACGVEPHDGALRRRRRRERVQPGGLPCVVLANGMAEIHTPDEHIAVADIERMVDVTLALVEAARCRCLSLRWGTVTAITERLDGLSAARWTGSPCVAYPRLTGPVEEGDTVIVNSQARELELGSGGFDVLYANLTRGLGLRRGRRART